MKRLTEHHTNKALGSYMVCSMDCIEDNCDCNVCNKLGEIVDRLAAYEDTGLEPEEIKAPINQPLALEELREMARAGLAVWCVDTDGIAQGLLCMCENFADSHIAPHIWLLDEESHAGVYQVGCMMELGAKFYRRKPEDGTT